MNALCPVSFSASSSAKFHKLSRTLLALLTVLSSVAQLPAQAPPKAHATDLLATQPLWFEATPDQSAMVSHFERRTFQVQQGGAVRIAAPVAGHATEVTLSLEGANPSAPVTGSQRLPGESNYLLGRDATTWRHQVAHFAQAKLAGVYAGIDLTYYGNGQSLEYDYAIAPQADPTAIRLQISDDTHLEKRTGDLFVTQPGSDQEILRLHKPVAYQLRHDGTRTPIAASYAQNDDASFSFTLGTYDRTQPLIIDPVITYSSYFGGSGFDVINDIKTDAAGDIYLLIDTNSIDLPVTRQAPGGCVTGCGPTNPSNTVVSNYNKDMYVAKLDPTGKTLLFSTYIGGSGDEVPGSFALGSDGTVYIAGETTSSDFPLVNQYSSLTSTDAYGTPIYSGTLTKLSADGSTILYSSLLGGGLVQRGEGCCQSGQNSAQPGSVAVGANGIAYLIGFAATNNEGYGFGTFRDQKGGTYTQGDGSFLAKFDTTKSGGDSLIFAMPYGLPNTQKGLGFTAMALDSKGNVWITGNSSFYDTIAPSPDAFQSVCDKGDPNNCDNFYLEEMDPTGAVIYATYFGGTTNPGGGPGEDQAFNIFLDPSDNIYVTGGTESVDYPLKNAAYTTFIDGNAFLTKFGAGGKSVLYSTYARTSQPLVAATAGGLATLAGINEGGEPVVNGFTSDPSGGYYDAYWEVFDTTQSGAASLLTASYLGAPGFTYVSATTVDAQGNLLFGGNTMATTLPIVNAYQAACNATCSVYGAHATDGFVTRVQVAPSTGSITLVPTTQAFPSTAVGAASAAMTSTLTNTTTAAFVFTPSFTDATDFKETDTCNGMVAAGASCTFSFTFIPQVTGALSSTFTLTGVSTALTLPVALSGTGTGLPAFTITPSTYSFGSVAEGSTPPSVTLVLKNTGNVPENNVIINFKESDPTAFYTTFSLFYNCPSLAAGATCNIVITFTPLAGAQATGTLTVSGDTGVTPVVAVVTATGTAAVGATLSTTSYNFGSVADGTTTPAATFSLSNTGGNSLTVSSITITGAGAAAFAIVPGSSTCGTAFAPKAACAFGVTFSPTTATTYNATVNIVDQAGTQTLSLTGTGAAPSAVLTSTSYDFGSVAINTSTPGTVFTLSNNGATSLTVSSLTIGGAGAAAFAIIPGSSTCGTAFAPNAACVFKVAFSPTAAIPYVATVSIVDQAGTQTLLLSGTGIVPPLPTLTPATFNFGNIAFGSTSASQDFTLTNTTGAALTITATPAINTTGTQYGTFGGRTTCAGTLAVGATCTVTQLFTATQQAGTATGTISITDSSGTQTATFSATSVAPPPPTLTPATFNFGNVPFGTTSASQDFTLTNATGAVLTITATPAINTTGTQYGTFGGRTTCAGTLAVGATCTVTQLFTASQLAGTSTGTITITDSAGTQTATFSATSTAPAAATFTPANFNFGNVLFGVTSTSQDFTLTNTTGAALTITATPAINTTGAQYGTFGGRTTCAGTLAVGATCTVTQLFTASQQAGIATGTITITDTAGTQTAAFTATSVAPPPATFTPASFNFGNVAFGATSASQDFTLTNTTGAALTITGTPAINTAGAQYGTFGGRTTCAGTLAVGASCTVTELFTASQQAGTSTGTITITDTAGTQTAAFTATSVAPPQPILMPASFNFGNVAFGATSASQDFTLTNTTGAVLTITSTPAINTTGTQYGTFGGRTTCAGTLAAGASCTVTELFTASQLAGTSSGTITIADSAGTQTAAFSATSVAPVVPTLSPSTLAFGSVPVGTISAPQLLTLSNTTTSTIAALSGITTPAQFGYATGGSCGNTLAAGANCTIAVVFQPTSAGAASGVFTVGTGATAASAMVTGTGTATHITVSPTALDFGSVTYLTTSPVKTFTITNPNAAAVSVVTTSGTTGTNGFGFTSICGVIPANGSCTDSLAFSPTKLGTFSGSVVLTFSDGSTATVSLAGVGVQQPASAFTPASVAFASIGAGETTASTTLTLTNPGPLPVTLATLVSTGPFPAVGGTCAVGQVLVSGASCTVFAAFSPTAPGTYNGNIVATLKDGSVLALPSMATAVFTGTAVVPLPTSVSPTALDFGSVTLNTTSPVKTFTITNPNVAAVSVVTTNGATGTNGFGFTNICGVIPANGSCTDSVEFSPTRLGPVSGSFVLTFSDGSTATVSLTGTGTSAPDFTITPSPASQAVAAGTTALYTLLVTPTGGAVTQPITFSATGLPAGAIVNFYNSPVTPGSAPAFVFMDVLTTTQKTGNSRQPLWPLGAPVTAAALLFFPWVRRRRMLTSLLGVLILSGISGVIMGCGVNSTSSTSGGTPTTITVTATSGSIQHTTTVTLTTK